MSLLIKALESRNDEDLVLVRFISVLTLGEKGNLGAIRAENRSTGGSIESWDFELGWLASLKI
jgi:hypothetical protein